MGSGQPDELRKRFQILERVAIFFTLPDNVLHALARRLAPASAAKGSVRRSRTASCSPSTARRCTRRFPQTPTPSSS